MKPTNHESIKNRMSKWLVAAIVLAATVPCFSQSASTTAGAGESRMVLVSIADRKLAVVENGRVLAYFPVAVGAAVSPSPTGEFVIVRRVANPTYYHAGVVIPTGKDNPVGTRWMGLNVKGYGIHGTNAPGSIGHATSHGCIRLRNRDVERLYTMLRVGDVVKIRGERDEEIAAVFGGGVDIKSSPAMDSSVGQ
ncbi:MAG: L,D-transpeptidase [Candidatus Sulfotelmatobacter sp.]